MSLPNNAAGAVVIDANILIASCSKESTEATARAALTGSPTKKKGKFVNPFLRK